MNIRAVETLMQMDDKDLADVLEHVLLRRAIGFEETFHTLTVWEQFILRLRRAVADWQQEMSR